jgi:hypothetical protein
MKSAGLSWVGTIVGVAGLAVVGIGGYNWLNSGCPLGGCGSETAIVQASAAAADAKSGGCCPLGEANVQTVAAKAECSDKSSCETATACESKTACGDTTEATVTTVAATAKAEGCCMNKSATECCKSEGKECLPTNCAEKADGCTDKTDKGQHADDPS